MDWGKMKTRVGIYLATDNGPDTAVVKGLQQADCDIVETRTVSEALEKIRSMRTQEGAPLVILVAEVQAGAIPLLILLRDVLSSLPPTLIFDRRGDDIHAVVKALQLGVRDYLLISDPEINRELGARLLAERAGAEQLVPHDTAASDATDELDTEEAEAGSAPDDHDG